LVVVLVLGMSVAGCGGHGRARGTIVFTTVDVGRVAFYGVHPDGTGLVRLPPGTAPYGTAAAWSPDGTKALVAGDKSAYVLDRANGVRERIRIPRLDPGDTGVAPWSPDGERLLLSTDRGNVVLDVKSGGWHAIATPDEPGEPAVWSGDGKQLLFTSGVDLREAPVDGGPARTIVGVPNVESVYDPMSSADGAWFSFGADAGLREGLYVVRSDGTHLHRIARSFDLSSAWSPTGERLAYALSNGVVVVDLANGRLRRLTNERLDDPANEPPVWSPDGRWILYRRTDLDAGATWQDHLQLWVVRSDGSGRHPVTHAFPVDYGDSAVWVPADLKGTAAPKPSLVSLRSAQAITTALPIVALAADGERAAVVQGFGTAADFGNTGGRVGPIVLWDPRRRTTARVPVHGCSSADDVLLAAGRVGYDCDNSSEGYDFDHALRLGSTQLVHLHGGEFAGEFLDGIVAHGRTVAFGLLSQTVDVNRFRFHRRTRIWESTAGRTKAVRTFRGEADLLALDDGRLAVEPVPCGSSRYCGSGTTVRVFAPGERKQTFAVDGRPVLGAALEGPRLVVLQRRRLTVFDLGSGHRRAMWPVQLGFRPAAELEDAAGDLVLYVVGAAIHVLRLSDGRDVVIRTPNATEPVFARLVPSGLFYAFNVAYAKRPGRLAFVTRSALDRALASRAQAN
jgi:Tol biopolymer transport system component